MQRIVNVGKDFSRHPAGRFPTDGKYNGQTFRQKFLTPFLKAGDTIKILLDDAIDYGSSFLEEAFGGLVRIEGFKEDFIRHHIEFVTDDDVLLYEVVENLKAEPGTEFA